jgi:hypothetical protein
VKKEYKFIAMIILYEIQEEIASVNLAKYRKLQHDLEEAEARARLAEKSLNQHRASSRSTTSVEESVTVSSDTCKPFFKLRCFSAAMSIS